ncbi:hypothetical protein LCGC14_2725150 [marine sediment metagenome]|uniref:Uncharacterized protein n=1 Tax=marine sediment metagenome TaxID=412755 RepID=A0A0F8Z903_9ZZZZ
MVPPGLLGVKSVGDSWHGRRRIEMFEEKTIPAGKNDPDAIEGEPLCYYCGFPVRLGHDFNCDYLLQGSPKGAIF